MGIIYAECGGFMYLMHSITTTNNKCRRVAGIFPFKAYLKKRLVSLGYRKVSLLEDTPIGPKGLEIKGHEFHYSTAQGIEDYPNKIYKVFAREGKEEKSYGVRYKNCIASYIHLHFASNPLLPKYFVSSCRRN